MNKGMTVRALCALGVAFATSAAAAHDETQSVRQWHDAHHPSCKFEKVLSRERLPGDDEATVEKWVIEACRGARYAYQVTTFEFGAMVSDFEEHARADVPGTEGEPQVAANAPEDLITQVTADALDAHEATLAPYIAQARATWPNAKKRYLAGLPEGQILFVTTRLFDNDVPRTGPNYEQIFVRVDAMEGATVRGRIASDIVALRTYRAGDPIDVAEADVIDWTIARPDGSEEGYLLGKYMDTLQEQAEKAQSAPPGSSR
ncbi:DUF2314 domain-containing protein [Lysobacter sp. KIS68-7]|uniref:DUF2314 domain-containing protein n=1 Tax=Lysobacter sp. KIS68-7 TaxID=2904252 RepID=UPI001E36173C|nr:DUF2314 domain-containing protein [Lysobacter sp. KIS68-7]UHQ18797.1 DUF2314 domain-containing protein [Lysobacter sp. KIS68-7]